MTACLGSVISFGCLYGPCSRLAIIVPANMAYTSIQRENIENTNLAKTLFPELYTRVQGLREDIIIGSANVTITNGYSRTLGSNFTDVFAVANPDLYEADKNSLKFLLKNQIGHIHGDTAFQTSGMAAAASFLTALAVPVLQSYLPGYVAPFAYIIPGVVALNVYGISLIEKQRSADKFACDYSTDKELRGGYRFLITLQKVYQGVHRNNPNVATAEGNLVNDRFNPKLTERISFVAQALAARGITFDPTNPNELNKMEKLTALHNKILSRN